MNSSEQQWCSRVLLPWMSPIYILLYDKGKLKGRKERHWRRNPTPLGQAKNDPRTDRSPSADGVNTVKQGEGLWTHPVISHHNILHIYTSSIGQLTFCTVLGTVSCFPCHIDRFNALNLTLSTCLSFQKQVVIFSLCVFYYKLLQLWACKTGCLWTFIKDLTCTKTHNLSKQLGHYCWWNVAKDKLCMSKGKM